MNDVIVLVGGTCSGKSTVEKMLRHRYGYCGIVKYTSRPKREYEVNGQDYYFLDVKTFKKLLEEDYFVEWSVFKTDWYYGTAKHHYADNKIVVADPDGLRQLRKEFGDEITAFYLKEDERTRLKRMIDRGDDLMECFRRIISDQGILQGVERDVNYTIDCTELTVDAIAEQVYGIIHRYM